MIGDTMTQSELRKAIAEEVRGHAPQSLLPQIMIAVADAIEFDTSESIKDDMSILSVLISKMTTHYAGHVSNSDWARAQETLGTIEKINQLLKIVTPNA